MFKIVFITLIIFSMLSLLFCTNNLKKEKLNTNEVLNDFRENNKTLVLLILGQSNAANYGSKLFSTEKKIYTLSDNKVSLAKDPLLGASGIKGNLWIPFSEILINKGYCEEVLIVCIAEGSSTVSDWSNGRYEVKLKNTLNQLKNCNITPNFILWQQGEQDNLLGTSILNYKSSFREIMEIFISYDVLAPVFLSLTSYCPSALNPINSDIRKAQNNLVKELKNVYLGPDTDIYNDQEYRHDGIHFSEKGAISVASDWAEKIINFHKIN